jgi:hypothetical protein
MKYAIILLIGLALGIASMHVDGPAIRSFLLQDAEAGGQLTPEWQVAEFMATHHSIKCSAVETVDFVCRVEKMQYYINDGRAAFYIGG